MIHPGRRKASYVANNMSFPPFTEKTMKDLVEKHIFFSVTTDASNNGTLEVFSTINHSYTVEGWIIHCLLAYFPDTNETTLGMFDKKYAKIK